MPDTAPQEAARQRPTPGKITRASLKVRGSARSSVSANFAPCAMRLPATVPHNKQRGKCPRIYKNKSGGVFHVHKCVWMIKSTGWYPSATVVHPADIPSTRYCGIQGGGTAFHT